MKLTVTLKGVDSISLRTKALIEAARTGMKFGVQEAAFILQEEAKLQVPVDTGRLRDSIHTETILDEPDKFAQGVAPDTEYAHAVEYGYHAINKAGRMQNTPAQPYLRPAWDLKKDEARQAIVDGIYESLEGVRH